jgi:chemotaxis protein MotB
VTELSALRPLKSRQAWPDPPVPPKSPPLWMVSLVDTFSLLLCFFVLMFSMGQLDVTRFHEIAVSLAENLPVTGPRVGGPPAPAVIQAPTLPVDFALNLDYLTSLVEGRIEKLSALSGMSVERRSDRLVLVPPSDVTFAAGATRPMAGAAPMLSAIADLIAHVPNRLEIRSAVSAEVPWETALERSNALARILRDAGYPGAAVAVAGIGGPPVALSLLPVQGSGG